MKKEKKLDEANQSKVSSLDFPVIGMGVSAGGLEALQSFFEKLPPNPGAAFVIVQHLSPDHNSFMAELLQRYTGMPVNFIEDGVHLENNHVYLIPPKVNITIAHGTLYHHPIIGRGLNLPIDMFFHSLAEDQKSNAVAIIMSGAGSDGTLGVRSIKEYGGITMVQDPYDAKFDGMPKSAIFSDEIDLVRSAGALAKELVSYLQHPLFTHPDQSEQLISENQKQYNRILSILKKEKHVDFVSYRQETIIRRLEKRVSINRFQSLQEYVEFLAKTPSEVETLFHELLIGVTRFFRDPEAFTELEQQCFASMFENCQNGVLRIWVASCSTGEEAYSIAILLKDYMLRKHLLADIKIFATDIDERSLKFAANGFYPQNVVSEIPPQYLAKYFSPRGNGYQISPDIRRMIIFAPQNLIDSPPFYKMDLVTCRNFLIYICPEAQQRVLSSFYIGLRMGGYLFLGASESLDEVAKGFETVAHKEKIFKKIDGYAPRYSPKAPMPLHLSALEYPLRGTSGDLNPFQENNELLSILEQVSGAFLHPSLVVDSAGDIIYAIRDAGKLLRIGSGRVSMNLVKNLPRDLGLIISSVLRRAEGFKSIVSAEIVLDDRPMIVRCLHITSENSGSMYYYLGFEDVTDLVKEAPSSDAIVSNESKKSQMRIETLEAEIRQQKKSLKLAVEQLEASNEELQASNEELIASNEELQSSNEELQSVNEELYTVNIEHVRKLEEISELNYDYENLLSNTQIGTLFLDDNLIVRKISRIASYVTNILQSDVGRPLNYFALKNFYPRFVQDVERVNVSKKMIEKELLVQRKTYCMRIVPYLVDDSTSKGIIITFVDLTECKLRAIHEAYESQAQTRMMNDQLDAAVRIARMAYFQYVVDSRACTGSSMLVDLLPLHDGRVPPLETWIVPEDLNDAKEHLNAVLSGKAGLRIFNFRSLYFGALRHYRMGVTLGVNTFGQTILSGVLQNMTQMIEEQQNRDEQRRLWEDSINVVPALFYAKDADDAFRYVFANQFFLNFMGKTRDEVIGKTDDDIMASKKQFLAEDVQVIDTDEVLCFENKMELPDGTARYFYTTKKQHIGAQGHRLVLGIGVDTTEQHLMIEDMRMANECLVLLLDEENFEKALREVVIKLCARLGASTFFWMSFDNAKKTVTCEYEYTRNTRDPRLFDLCKDIPFSTDEEWYQCYKRGAVWNVTDFDQDSNRTAVFAQCASTFKKKCAMSMYATGFSQKNVLVGSVGFIYSQPRAYFSPSRISYLMSFAGNIFNTLLCRWKRTHVTE